MESLPVDLGIKIFRLLDFQSLATAQQVCRKWKSLGSDDNLWFNLFKDRWGEDQAAFYAPVDSKSWKNVFEVQDRCDRVGLGLKIIREGGNYYLIHQGEIQRHLGTRVKRKQANSSSTDLPCDFIGEDFVEGEQCFSILDKILFFIGDLEVASRDSKLRHLM